MRNSYEIGQFIKQLREKKGMTSEELGKRLGVTKGTISRYENGSRKISMDDIPKFAIALDVSPTEILINMEQVDNLKKVSEEMIKVPILGPIACGEPLLIEDNFEGYSYEPRDSLPKGNIFILRAKGQSMEPSIPDGANVYIREQPDVEHGEIAAVIVNGDTEATLKRVKKQGDTIILMPDNNAFEPYIISPSNPARIVGKAVSFKVAL